MLYEVITREKGRLAVGGSPLADRGRSEKAQATV